MSHATPRIHLIFLRVRCKDAPQFARENERFSCEPTPGNCQDDNFGTGTIKRLSYPMLVRPLRYLLARLMALPGPGVWVVATLCFLTAGCAEPPVPTIAEGPSLRRVPYQHVAHGVARDDAFNWLRHAGDNDKLQRYLETYYAAENAYTRRMLDGGRLRERLHDELAGRLPSRSLSVPVRIGGYEYFQAFGSTGDHPIYARRGVAGAPGLAGDGISEVGASDVSSSEVLLDGNVMAAGHAYFRIRNWVMAPDDTHLAYAVDTTGDERHEIGVRHVGSALDVGARIEGASHHLAWQADGSAFYYVDLDRVTQRAHRVKRHVVGTDTTSDAVIYTEPDVASTVGVHQTRTGQFVVITSSSIHGRRLLLIDANKREPPRSFVPRVPGHRYRLRHVPGRFFVRSNHEDENFRLYRVDEEDIGAVARWVPVNTGSSDQLVDMEVFSEHLVLHWRRDFVSYLTIHRADGARLQTVEFDEPAFVVDLIGNPDIDAREVSYRYSSLREPPTVVALRLATGARDDRQASPVPTGYRPGDYRTERRFIDARDGRRVPASIVYRKDRFRRGRNPLYLQVYGAYGAMADLRFEAHRVSLLDRGFIVGIAHVRGGGEMGENWHRSGSVLERQNGINDFIDVTRGLLAQQIGDPDRVFAAGSSAGGLIVAAAINQAPELYTGVVLKSPFLDLISTMSDAALPLTEQEYAEWGDPRRADHFGRMLGFSPFDGLRAARYPQVLVMAGARDERVRIHEPVKWVQRLRERSIGNARTLIDIDLSTGHGGASGRYDQHHKRALEYAFMLDVADMGE
jgi:oligopeptidase B